MKTAPEGFIRGPAAWTVFVHIRNKESLKLKIGFVLVKKKKKKGCSSLTPCPHTHSACDTEREIILYILYSLNTVQGY